MAANPDKEAELTARMEKIKKKNAELQRRHEEVAADKLNAEISSSSFNERRKNAPPEEKPIVKERVSVKSRLGPIPTERQSGRQSQQLRQPKIQPTDVQQATENVRGGPPPDPKYSFLSDRSRENCENVEREIPSREDESRRHPSNYGGRDFDNVRANIQRKRMQERNQPRYPPRNKMEMSLSMTGRERRQYETWRTERDEIENQRMHRQKTATGQWRREWDKNKNMGSSEYEEPETDYRNPNNIRRAETEYRHPSSNRRSETDYRNPSHNRRSETDFRNPSHNRSDETEYKNPSHNRRDETEYKNLSHNRRDETEYKNPSHSRKAETDYRNPNSNLRNRSNWHRPTEEEDEEGYSKSGQSFDQHKLQNENLQIRIDSHTNTKTVVLSENSPSEKYFKKEYEVSKHDEHNAEVDDSNEPVELKESSQESWDDDGDWEETSDHDDEDEMQNILPIQAASTEKIPSEQPVIVGETTQDGCEKEMLEQNCEKEVTQTEENFDKEITPTKKDFEDEVEQTEKNFEDEVKQTEKNFEDEVKQTEKNFEDEVKQTEKNFEKVAQTEKNFEKEVTQTEENFEKEVTQTEENFEKEVTQIEENFEKEVVETEENFEKEVAQKENQIVEDVNEQVNVKEKQEESIQTDETSVKSLPAVEIVNEPSDAEIQHDNEIKVVPED